VHGAYDLAAYGFWQLGHELDLAGVLVGHSLFSRIPESPRLGHPLQERVQTVPATEEKPPISAY
jgi:hypothetical protein